MRCLGLFGPKKAKILSLLEDERLNVIGSWSR